MAPALTKVLKDGHGIHLSSRPTSLRLDSAMCSTELESLMRSTDDDNLQMMWQNLPLFPSLDSCLPVSPLDMPANSVPSQCLQESASQCDMVPLSGPASLPRLLSSSEVLRDSHQVASVFPGVPDMLLAPERNGHESRLLHGREAPSECGPGGCDVHRKAVLSRQAGLQNRGQGLQRRLRALLGEHALLHCSQQLEGLKRHCELGGGSLYSLDSIQPGVLLLQVGREPHRESTALSSLAEVEEFRLSSQAVLRGLQEALDSEATASSSSSDEEQEEDVIYGRVKTSPAGGCERRWLEERGELGSGWSWLQLRLAELEGRIQQLAELHGHIRSTKGGVVLAESQPLTDEQIQQTLLRDMTGLSCRALDADPESCSPTRLLHNIERQSAQLSQLVNTLMPPLSLSPLSKQPHACNGKRVFRSGQRGDSAFGNCKRRKLGTRRLKANVCARTRPLIIYHKPKLFTLGAFNPGGPRDLGRSTSTLSSSLSTSSCSCCSSRDPAVLCSDPDCGSSSGALLSSRTSRSTPRHSSDAPLCHHLKRAREEWCQRPLVIDFQPRGAARHDGRRSTPPHNSHRCKQYAGHCKSRVIGLSPFGMAGSAQSQHRRASQRKRRRRHVHGRIEDKEDVLYQLCDIEDQSDEVRRQSYIEITHKQASQGFVRRRHGVSVCDINSVVIPVSVANVETLQYKDILTPSWRAVETSPLIHREAEDVEDSEEGQTEDLADEVFAKRHLALERREKLCWGSWGKRNCCRPPKRFGSRLSGSGGGMCTSGEESPKKSYQLDTDEQQSSEEWLPQTPWKRRMFPLDDDDDDDDEALRSDDAEVPSDSHLSPARSCGATLPSGGHIRSRTLSGS